MSCCTFCGHHDVAKNIRGSIRDAVEHLIAEGVDCYYVGNHGNFDHLALSVLREMKKMYPNINYSVVLAYMPGETDEYTPYQEGETLYPDGLENVPYRYAISYRNKWMVEHSDYIISYVTHNFGGAGKTLQLAQRKKLKIIEL